MLNLSSVLIAEKNKLSSSSAWIVLLEITIPSYATVIRLVKNNEDVVFGGETYTAFPMEIDTSSWTSKGDIPSLGVRVSNIANTFNQILREYDGGVGGEVVFTLVSSEHLTEDYAELQRTFTILQASVDNYWVSWTLGSSNPLRQRFPLYTYMAHYCNWVQNFKGAECKFAGAAIVKKVDNPVVKFSDDFATFAAQWQNQEGSGTAEILTYPGLNFLHISGQMWNIHSTNITFNPVKMYRVTCRLKRSSGAGKLYIGVAGVAANGTTLVNTTGANSYSSQHYVAAFDAFPNNIFTEYVGYFSGTAASGTVGSSPTLGNAGKLHTNVAYIRPLILCNYSNQVGSYVVDYYKLEELDIVETSNTTCNGTWQQCQDYNNTENFGGFPGLYNPEVRIV